VATGEQIAVKSSEWCTRLRSSHQPE